jgi:hypothetical protein
MREITFANFELPNLILVNEPLILRQFCHTLHSKRILKKREKRKRKENVQSWKVKEVKPHLPIQGHDKIQEKKWMRNSRQVGETFLEESENGDHIFL